MNPQITQIPQIKEARIKEQESGSKSSPAPLASGFLLCAS
jgi:hypothetical protein